MDTIKKIKQIFQNHPPIPVLLICLFETLGLILLPSSFGHDTTAHLGLWYQIYLFLTGFMSLTIIYTLWKMKKIGVVIYAGSYAIHNIVALIAGNWMIGVIIIPLIGMVLISLSRNKFN